MIVACNPRAHDCAATMARRTGVNRSKVPEADDARPRLIAVAGYFLWLGATGFGGPVALCGLMERDLVERRGWLDKAQMRDVIAVCQTMPGPLAVQVGIFVGYLRCGFWGALVSGWALILPASVMVAALAVAYVHLHGLPWLAAIVYGVGPAVIALILQSWWRLVRLGMEDRFQYIVAAVGVAATLALPGALTGVFLGAGLLGTVWYGPLSRRRGPPTKLFELASSLLFVKLVWFFFVTGAFTFGGGLAVVPLLERGLVQEGHWLSPANFLTAVAVGMLTPGPVMTAATFAGYLVAGVPGALVCTVAIYLPSFLVVLLAAPPLMRHRHNPLVQGFVRGVYAVAIGAILGASLLLGWNAIGDWVTIVIAAGSLIALIRFRISNPLVVGVAAAAGWMAFGFSRPDWVLPR
jgi:chromate transporter